MKNTLSTSSPESEAALIGCLLYDNSKIADLAFLKEADFYSAKHGHFFQIIRSAYEDGEFIDPILLVEAMHSKGFLDTDSKLRHCQADIAEMTAENFSTEAALDHGRLIQELSLKRQTQDYLNEALTNQESDAWSAGDFIQGSLAKLEGLQKQVGQEKTFSSVSESIGGYLERVLDPGSQERGLETKYTEIDAFLGGGLKKGQLVIIAARPGIGKTTLSQNIGMNIARLGQAALFISLEMTHDDLMLKNLSAESGIALDKIERQAFQGLSDTDAKAQNDAAYRMQDWRFYNVVQSGINIQEIEQQLNNINRDLASQGEQPLALLIIDYLQLMRPVQEKRQRTRENEISEISSAIKAMSLKYDIPILLVCQLNRDLEKRSDKTPKLYDLRESGSLEQDADVVLLMHREDSEDTSGSALDHPVASEAIIQVAKNRRGKVGRAKLDFFKHRSRFENKAKGGGYREA